MNNTRIFILMLSTALFVWGCNRCNNNAVEGIEASAEWERFDSIFYAIGKPEQLVTQLQLLQKQDSLFYSLYTGTLYNFNPKQERYNELVFKHINSAQNQAVRKRCDSVFGDFSSIYGEVDLLSKYYKLHYPKQDFPIIHTCYSGMAGLMAWHYGESDMLVDLDMYLGADFEAYPQFFPNYKFRYYTPEFLPQNIAKELIRKQYLNVEQTKPKNMLEMMLIEAAKIHDVKQLMPCRESYKLMEYTAEQWEWLQKEESNIWKYFLKEKLLFESDYNEYRPLVGEAPESKRSGVAVGAPPRIAVFAGFQILDIALKNSAFKNAKELIINKSSEEILELAKYKP